MAGVTGKRSDAHVMAPGSSYSTRAWSSSATDYGRDRLHQACEIHVKFVLVKVNIRERNVKFILRVPDRCRVSLDLRFALRALR